MAALQSVKPVNTSDVLGGGGGEPKPRMKRRQSIQESFQSLTASLAKALGGSTTSLTAGGAGGGGGGGGGSRSSDEVARSRLTKGYFRELLSAHFRQPELKVTKFSLHNVPNPHTNQILFEAEIWIKDSRSRRKLDLMVKYPAPAPASASTTAASDDHNGRDEDHGGDGNGAMSWVLDGTHNEMEREFSAYSEVVDDLWHYLRDEKGIAEPQQYLCVPMRYVGNTTDEAGGGPNGDGGCGGGAVLSDVNETSQTSFGNGDEEENIESGADKILVLQDLFNAGYHAATQDRLDENGLDFNHSIMAISRLARFHAASYAMRKEHKMDFRSRYPFLATDPVYNAQTAELFAKTQSSIGTRLFNIFQQGSQNIKEFSTHFLDAVKNMHARQSEFVSASLDTFGVLCHGDLWRQNVLFFYGSGAGSVIECQTDCLDVRFEDLHRVRFSSCVTDLLYFLYTTVDFDVRRDHVMDFLAVYHDHFSKTVEKLAPKVTVFTREELFDEYKSKVMYGFLEGICLFSNVYESQLKKHEAERERNHRQFGGDYDGELVPPRYSDYRDAVVAMVEDVVRIKFQGKPPKK